MQEETWIVLPCKQLKQLQLLFSLSMLWGDEKYGEQYHYLLYATSP